MKKWIMILVSLPMLWACDSNEMTGPVYNPADIQVVDSFLDVRDHMMIVVHGERKNWNSKMLRCQEKHGVIAH